MARLLRQEKHHLAQNADLWKQRRLFALLFYGLGLLSFLSGITFVQPMLTLFGLTLFAVGYMVRKRTKTQVEMLEAGLAGELQAESLLRQLPANYSILSDLVLASEGGVSQIDHIVVGPSGVFVVETKNMNGAITGVNDEKRWVQQKHLQHGRVVAKDFYNPTKQVGTHVYRVAGLLRHCGIRAWVQGIVYFSHRDVTLSVTTENVPVFSAGPDTQDGILHYITTYPGNRLSPDTIRRIIEILSKHTKSSDEA